MGDETKALEWVRDFGCDICGDPVYWTHPLGGRRCLVCPRPRDPGLTSWSKSAPRKPGTAEALPTTREALMMAAATWTSEKAKSSLRLYDPKMAAVILRDAEDQLLEKAIQFAAEALLNKKTPAPVRAFLEQFVPVQPTKAKKKR